LATGDGDMQGTIDLADRIERELERVRAGPTESRADDS